MQTILVKYHTLFLSRARKEIAKFVICSCDWRFRVKSNNLINTKVDRVRSGSVVLCLTRGRGFEPHRRHCVDVLEQDIFILA